MPRPNGVQNFIHVEIVQPPVQQNFAPIRRFQLGQRVCAARRFLHIRRAILRICRSTACGKPRSSWRSVRARSGSPIASLP